MTQFKLSAIKEKTYTYAGITNISNHFGNKTGLCAF